MPRPSLLLSLFLVSFYSNYALLGLSYEPSEGYDKLSYEDSSRLPSRFVFTRPDQQFSTEWGEFKAVILEEEDILQKRRFAVGTLIMEPQALLLPHYLNGPSVLYIHRGRAIVSQVLREGKTKSKSLTANEVHTISEGTLFCVVNPQANERLEAVLLVDLSDVPRHVKLECFHLSGGRYPRSVLSGFTDRLLASAFKVCMLGVLSGFTDRLLASAFKTTPEKIRVFLLAQHEGPIVDISEMVEFEEFIRKNSEEVCQENTVDCNKKKKKEQHYHLFDDKYVFRNQNGWSTSLDGTRYKGLKKANLGMFAVGLKSGSMVAPHWNPDVTAIGVVTHGRGRIQIVRSDGFMATNKEVDAGTVFVIPRYHPSSEIAGSDSDFEFIGFTTSSEPMDPQFLAGTNSVLHSFERSFLRKIFRVKDDKESLEAVLETQPDKVLLEWEDSDWW